MQWSLKILETALRLTRDDTREGRTDGGEEVYLVNVPRRLADVYILRYYLWSYVDVGSF